MRAYVFISLFVLATVCLLSTSKASLHRRIFSSRNSEATFDKFVEDVPPYVEKYFDQVVDHFGFKPTTPPTFPMRYLECSTFWDGSKDAPILIYTGNEGSIEMFYENSGFVFEVAKELKALVFFPEHRYYGKSKIPGAPAGNFDYLTSEQALADYAIFVGAMKEEYGMEKSPVIAFGGSYGGMLSAWFRMKYPHVVAGAIAASAPVAQFEGWTSPFAFSEVVSKDFDQCADAIRRGWKVLYASSLDDIWKHLHLCEPTDPSERSIDAVYNELQDAMVSLAMIDYPYPTSFLQPVPANPVNATCTQMHGIPLKTNTAYLDMLRQTFDVYYNSTGTATCYNVTEGTSPTLDDSVWGYQACTEMVFPMANNGDTDMFIPSKWDFQTYAASCKKEFGVNAELYWAATEYGARNLKGASNIVFSNGNLDPWSSGGVLESVSETVVALHVEGGAHHLDLRASNPLDPQSVRDVRKKEMEHINMWIQQHRASKSNSQ